MEGFEIEVKPVPFKVQSLYYRNKSTNYCEISFDGKKFYTFKKSRVVPYYWIKKFDYIILYTDNEVIRCDGYYDKPNKIINFFYNQNINKRYKGLIKYQKLERSKQTFLVPDERKRRKEKNMGKLDVKTTDEIPSPEAGKTYTIQDVEEFTSAVRGFKGLRVTLVDEKKKEYIESLWVRDIVGPNSKLGSFIVTLGKDTDKWKGKTVTFVKWSEGKREISL